MGSVGSQTGGVGAAQHLELPGNFIFCEALLGSPMRNAFEGLSRHVFKSKRVPSLKGGIRLCLVMTKTVHSLGVDKGIVVFILPRPATDT